MRLAPFLVLIACFSFCSCQSTQGYKANSLAEAQAYAKRAVETGVVHKGGEAELISMKSAGKPSDGKWDPQKIERFVARYVSNNPRRVEINLAATKGLITEREHMLLTADLDAQEAAEAVARAQTRAAALNHISASLNNMSASMNQTTANINNNTARINQSTVNSLNSRLYTPSYTPLYTPTYTPRYSKPGTISLYGY